MSSTSVFAHSFVHDQSPARVVLFGGTGVIGKALRRDLERNKIPVVSFGSQELNLVEVHAPSRLIKLLRPTDSVVVLAGIAPNRGRGLDTMVDNIRMGIGLCEALVRQPVAHIVYVSSDAVYPRNIEMLDEQTPVEPSDPYSAMHLTRERLFSGLSRLPVAILRSTQISSSEDTHNAYGPNRFRQMAKQNGKIQLFGKGEDKRDHIVSSDVARIIHGCLLKRSHGILNVATGRSLSFAEVAEIVGGCFAPPPHLEFLPRPIPLTHRYFDVGLLRLMFPDLCFTPLEVDEPTIQHNRQLISLSQR
ncbi:MAG: NAD-dependent epimerase/dehydratase family protein [Nitrospirales bacterium]|nr:NAD(P)-dependent oxidoreductase [Nitrospirales bacterium]